MALQAGVAQDEVGGWALAFVLLRFAYGVCYLADLAALRSLVWLLAMLVVLRLMAAALWV